MRRYVLALEGADGSGKSTVALILRELCELRGIPVRLLGRSVADAPPPVAALTGALRAHGPAYTLEADLMIRVAREFQRAREAGVAASGLVVLDRFVLSVLARSRADDVLPSLVEPLLLRALEIASLDATLFIDCPFEIAWARVHASAASGGRALGAKELRGERFNRAFLEHQRSLFDSGSSVSTRRGPSRRRPPASPASRRDPHRPPGPHRRSPRPPRRLAGGPTAPPGSSSSSSAAARAAGRP